MIVTAFDFWDTGRTLGVQLDTETIGLDKIKKNQTFNIEDVTYMVTKVFKKKSLGDQKLIETRMVKYKVPNTVTTHVHKCAHKLREMQNITIEGRKILVEKYGESTVNSWDKFGRVKLKMDTLAHQCPGCKTVFYKDKNLKPKSFEVTSLKGKKKLKRRKK